MYKICTLDFGEFVKLNIITANIGKRKIFRRGLKRILILM